MDIDLAKTICEKLNKFTPAASDSSYITITEWPSEEGWDIDIDGKLFRLSIDELAAINYLTGALTYEDKKTLCCNK